MSQRLSKLAEYLYNNNYEMAVEHHERSRESVRSMNESEEVMLLLAKAYFLSQKYQTAIELATRLQNSRQIKVVYESHFIEFKAWYMQGKIRLDILEGLSTKLRTEGGDNPNKYIKEIEEVLHLINRKPSQQYNGSQSLEKERREFDAMFREEDDRSVVMEGMPMFLVSRSWYDNWKEYTATKGEGGALKQERQHPGPITQFDLVDQIYNIYFDSKSNKDYTNRYVFSTIDYFMVPKRCWLYFKQKYGGIEAKRFNISYIDKPHEIFTEVHLKRILIARYDTDKTLNKQFVWVQISKKENWEGLRKKLEIGWGSGIICSDENKTKQITQTEIFQEIDTVGKQYLYVISRSNDPSVPGRDRCGNRKCSKTGELKFCQCKVIKYCDMNCLKEDWKNHKAKCELEQEHLRRRPVTFKEYNLEEKDYGGKRGVVGLKNLGNTCYMNSGLQCLSNTRELTDYFMKDEFKGHINHSNGLGTKGNLACSYAELVREMWTGNSQSVAPTRLKKKIGEFATQFSGYGQQDSQEFISYLIDGLQEDLNLVKKKETFEVGDDIKPDHEMSQEREVNDSKRIQSYIRNLMVGQFKSTIICGTCNKVSVCFDPYMLISLPIPTSRERSLFFVSSSMESGAIKISIEVNNTTSLHSLAIELAKTYNSSYNREIREGTRQMVLDNQLLFLCLDGQKFTISNFYDPKEKVVNTNLDNILFALQIPQPKRDEEVILCEYEYNGERTSYPRLLKFARSAGKGGKEAVIYQSLARGLEKGAPKSSYADLVASETLSKKGALPFESIVVRYRRKLKLSTFSEGHNCGFYRRLSDNNEQKLSLEDCFASFAGKQKLQKENTVYCNRCKEHREVTKQMEIYKTNKILVLTFKRFTRQRKIVTGVDFPVQGLDIGPYVLCKVCYYAANGGGKPMVYDLYGVVNHHGSLYGGHYTAYCLNFLDHKWYEFNDSRVSKMSAKEVVSVYSYVLFYRRRD